VLFSTDLIHEVLRKHQADNVLLRAAHAGCRHRAAPILKRLGDLSPAIQGESPIGNSTMFRRWRCR